MEELHKSQYDTPIIEPNEGQRGLLCSNKVSLCCPSLSSSSKLSESALIALDELGLVLKSIHERMTAEGYSIVDGGIQKI